MCTQCLGDQFDDRQWTDNNGAQSRSGSIAEDPRYDGPSADNMKFEGDMSDSGNNQNIGRTGWGS
jgi:hypothetical protein